MNKILVSEGIIHLLELPDAPNAWTDTEEVHQQYERDKTAAIDEAKKNGKFEEQEMIKEFLPEEALEFTTEFLGTSYKAKDGIYDQPEGLETERRQQSRKKGNAEWLDGEPMVYADGSEWEYRTVVRITKQKQ